MSGVKKMSPYFPEKCKNIVPSNCALWTTEYSLLDWSFCQPED